MRDELDRARRTLISTTSATPRSLLAAVAIGGAFGLGILAGGVGEARGNAPVVDDALAAARARTDLLAHKQGEIKLAYPAELLAPETAPSTKPIAAPAHTAAAEHAVANKPAATAPAADKPTADASADDKPMSAPAPERAAHVQDGPDAGARLDTKPDPDATPAPAEPRDRPSIQETLAKVLGGAPPTAHAQPAPKAKTFALQVASLPERPAADALAGKLAGQGLNARVVVGEVGGRSVYRVRVGSFAERDKAEGAKAKLAMPSFIVGE